MKLLSRVRFRLWHSQIVRGDFKVRLQAVGKLKGGFEMELVFFKREKFNSWKQFAKIPYLAVPQVKLLLLDADKAIDELLKRK